MHKVFEVIKFLSDKRLQEEIMETSRLYKLDQGDIVIREGEYVKVLPIVLKGRIRIFQDKEDRQILLYYVGVGQTCMISLSACFYDYASSIKAVTTEPTTILAIPTQYISIWQRKYHSWNNFVIRTFRQRYDELLLAFERVAFEHVDDRIWNYLNDKLNMEGSRMIDLSHQMLANELGTTRVVVSRILKRFEKEGRLRLYRGKIEVL